MASGPPSHSKIHKISTLPPSAADTSNIYPYSAVAIQLNRIRFIDFWHIPPPQRQKLSERWKSDIPTPKRARKNGGPTWGGGNGAMVTAAAAPWSPHNPAIADNNGIRNEQEFLPRRRRRRYPLVGRLILIILFVRINYPPRESRPYY